MSTDPIFCIITSAYMHRLACGRSGCGHKLYDTYKNQAGHAQHNQMDNFLYIEYHLHKIPWRENG